MCHATLVREGCQIENRLNLGHCPNLLDLPPSPKTWDDNIYVLIKLFSDNKNIIKRNKKMEGVGGEMQMKGLVVLGGGGALINCSKLLFENKLC